MVKALRGMADVKEETTLSVLLRQRVGVEGEEIIFRPHHNLGLAA